MRHFIFSIFLALFFLSGSLYAAQTCCTPSVTSNCFACTTGYSCQNGACTPNSGIIVTCPDADKDGYASAGCGGTDCNDSNASINPSRAETCNGIDDDCSGAIDNNVTVPSDGNSCTDDICKNGKTYPAASSSNVCRAAAGNCDKAEYCTGTSTVCPADAFQSSATSCRASAGVCDSAEKCTGSSASCPADSFKAATVTCRSSAGTCDSAETCTGKSATCPADAFKSSATTCRTSGGVCDIAEACTGSSAACPTDAKQPASTLCRASAGDCDITESCTGTTSTCPTNKYKSAGTVCRAATGQCDVAETCSGASGTCSSDKLAATGTACSDSNECTNGETCVAGSCQGGTAVSSDDNNVCTADSCDSAKGGVVHTPITGGGTLTCGVGACANSIDQCLNGSVQTCTPKSPGTEICDGLDNDCDGVTDEGSAEICDGKDNDCDGSVDEGFDTDGDGVTTCGGDCDDDFNSIYPGATEKCDGLDNNCDGKTDEGFALKGAACSDGLGQCQKGVYLCSADGASLYCKLDGPKANGTACDDNNKCTQTDVCLAGQCAGSNQVKCSALGQCYDAGICDKSTGLCSNPAKADGTSCSDSSECTSGEVCVGGSCAGGAVVSSDDNNECTTDSCDSAKGGVVHTPITGGGILTCGVGACKNSVDKCASGVEQTCTAKTGTTEVCGDNIDNDCDGIIDTKVTDPNGNVYEIGVTTCSKGTGACKGDGVYICNAVGKPECNAVENDPLAVEICDGKGVDEDCDGLTDLADSDCACIDGQTKACYNGASGTLGIGACEEGVVTCAKGKWGSSCTGAVTPSVEKCDAADNDCDGKTDEGFCTINGACYTASDINPSNQCQNCNPNLSQNSWSNKADGVSCDDGNTCTTNDKCSAGTCSGGQAVQCMSPPSTCYYTPGTCGAGGCTYELRSNVSGPAPTTEICDGLDNDCNGKTDEDFYNKGQECSAGVGECKMSGTWECKPDGSGTYCNAAAGNSSSEICDGLDNDCDGTPDNNFTVPLADKQFGVCEGSKKLCLGNKGGLSEPNYALITGYEASETLCDGKDNDCDGGIDENLKNVCGRCGA
ncbi:MAG: hypothetical protein HYU98_02220, partial [Deltaproteobacteria bacterium]|nr:hypothetical protein [Deltaproteobacteria bacterium]